MGFPYTLCGTYRTSGIDEFSEMKNLVHMSLGGRLTCKGHSTTHESIPICFRLVLLYRKLVLLERCCCINFLVSGQQLKVVCDPGAIL